jgi:cation transport ATPase
MAEENEVKKLKLQIQELICAGCVPEVEQDMRQQRGVIWATINFAAGEVTIIYDPAAFNADLFVQAISNIGFQLTFKDEPAWFPPATTWNTKPLARMQQWVRTLSRSF